MRRYFEGTPYIDRPIRSLLPSNPVTLAYLMSFLVTFTSEVSCDDDDHDDFFFWPILKWKHLHIKLLIGNKHVLLNQMLFYYYFNVLNDLEMFLLEF